MTIQALLYPGPTRLHPLMPGCPMFEHGIDDGQQLAHAGSQGHLLGFAGGAQAQIEDANRRIEAGRHDRAHIENGTDLCASAPHRASPSERPAIAIERGDADEGGDLFVRQRAQLREIGQQRCGQDRPDAGDAAQQLVFLAPDGTLANGLGQLRVRLLQGAFEPADMGAQILADGGPCAPQPVLLRRQHLDELTATSNQGGQGVGLLVGQRAGLRSYHLCKVRQHLGIQRIRLGQLPGGFGKIPHL